MFRTCRRSAVCHTAYQPFAARVSLSLHLFVWMEDRREFMLFPYRPRKLFSRKRTRHIYRNPKTHLERVQSRVRKGGLYTKGGTKSSNAFAKFTAVVLSVTHQYELRKVLITEASVISRCGAAPLSSRKWVRFSCTVACISMEGGRQEHACTRFRCTLKTTGVRLRNFRRASYSYRGYRRMTAII